jgi:hypothetical protein
MNIQFFFPENFSAAEIEQLVDDIVKTDIDRTLILIPETSGSKPNTLSGGETANAIQAIFDTSLSLPAIALIIRSIANVIIKKITLNEVEVRVENPDFGKIEVKGKYENFEELIKAIDNLVEKKANE